MPFRLSNAPSTFQRLMETVLVGLTRSCFIVYLDDVMIIGKSFLKINQLGGGFERKPEKCCLAESELFYLGIQLCGFQRWHSGGSS